MILGVCDWLGSKFSTDPLVFRIIFVVLALAYGTGIGLYLILWIIKAISK
ncbi:MAG: PspC domain-containing protein [Flavobacteriales bacterium]|nr:PspC domain-containing protein [Flavobacteriales bacterium]